MDIKKIMEKWVEFTEVDPTAHKFVITNRNVSVYDYNREIKSALENGGELDCALMLKMCFDEYIQNTYYSVFDVLNGTHEYNVKIQQANELETLLLDDEICDYADELLSDIERMSKAYDIYDKISSLTTKEKMLIMLNAKRACNKLDIVQFKKGKENKENPKYIKPIRAFYDINQLLIAAASTDNFNGITLNCLIDESNTSYSYFLFIIKNGDNVWMVSDRPKGCISRKFTSRADGQRMDERISLFMFPYELIGLELTKYDAKIKTTALSNNIDGLMLGDITKCSDKSSLWVACCMGILYNKFFVEKYDDAPMVITGGMLALPKPESNELVPTGSYGIELANKYQLIPARQISFDDVKKNDIKYSEIHKLLHFNDWLIEKYKDQIDDSIFNIIDEKGTTEVSIITNDEEYKRQMYSFERNSIGTPEELENNRLWIARSNMANQISVLFEKEWHEIKYNLYDWYRKKLEERKDFLAEAIAKEELFLTTYEYTRIKDDYIDKFNQGQKIPNDAKITFSVSFDQKRAENCLKIEENNDDFYSSIRYMNLYQKDENRKAKSWFNGKPISNIVRISVNSSQAIADVLGLQISDLPEMLQHYTPYGSVGQGNNILYQLDPIEHITNIISEFPADIKISISKSEIREFKKKYIS